MPGYENISAFGTARQFIFSPGMQIFSTPQGFYMANLQGGLDIPKTTDYPPSVIQAAVTSNLTAVDPVTQALNQALVEWDKRPLANPSSRDMEPATENTIGENQGK